MFNRRAPADEHVLEFYDIIRARIHSPSRRTIVIKVPREDDECNSGYAVPNKSMDGTKDAAQRSDSASENAMTAMGFDTGAFALFCIIRAQWTCPSSDTGDDLAVNNPRAEVWFGGSDRPLWHQSFGTIPGFRQVAVGVHRDRTPCVVPAHPCSAGPPVSMASSAFLLFCASLRATFYLRCATLTTQRLSRASTTFTSSSVSLHCWVSHMVPLRGVGAVSHSTWRNGLAQRTRLSPGRLLGQLGRLSAHHQTTPWRHRPDHA